MTSLGFQNLPIDAIKLDEGNPRIAQILELLGGEVTSERIALALSYQGSGDASVSYNSLKESIKVSGGIIHPIVVSKEEDGTYVAIEGNTRLQIYNEFNMSNPNGTWSTIPCLVYDRLTPKEKDEIRLQSHLVGPRNWDAYSKAKYLFHLSEQEYLTMDAIIAMCGGRRSDIQKTIDAYKCMHFHYEPYATANGIDINIQEFSKFQEYIKSSTVKNAFIMKGYTDQDFAEFVAKGNIDNAQKVRCIPEIFTNSEAFEKFKQSNLTEAERIVIAARPRGEVNIDGVPYEVLCNKVNDYLSRIELREIKALANDPTYASKKDALNSLLSILNITMSDISSFEQ